MQFVKIVTAFALAMPIAAMAQTAKPANQPVALEIVSTGVIDAPATKISVGISFTVQGKSQKEADKAKTAKYAEVLAALKQEGVQASAVTDDADAAMKLALADTSGLTTEADELADAAAEAEPEFTASEAKTVVFASMGQYQAAKSALENLDVTVGAPEAELDDAGALAARRQAKAKALRDARADADAYAREMGLRVSRVSRISEVGNNLFLPGLQNQFEDAMAKGKKGFEELFESKPGTIKIRSSIVVEFVLAP